MRIDDIKIRFQEYSLMDKSKAVIDLIRNHTSEPVTCKIPSYIWTWLILNSEFRRSEFSHEDEDTEFVVGTYDNITFVVSAEVDDSIIIDS